MSDAESYDPRTNHAAPVTTLRGAGVNFNARKVAQIAIAILMAGLAVLTVLLFVSAAHKNAQISRLHHNGVPVTVSITGCIGLLGGSGSNDAGYSCSGSFTLQGHSYTEGIPGDTFYRPGTKLAAIAVPGDPKLVSPAATVRDEHTSGRVYLLPAVLTALFVLAAIGLLLWWRRSAPRLASKEVRPTT